MQFQVHSLDFHRVHRVSSDIFKTDHHVLSFQFTFLIVPRGTINRILQQLYICSTMHLSRMFHVEHSKKTGAAITATPVNNLIIEEISVVDVCQFSVLLDEFLTGFYLVTHEECESLISLLGICKCNSEEFTSNRIHCRFPELL